MKSEFNIFMTFHKNYLKTVRNFIPLSSVMFISQEDETFHTLSFCILKIQFIFSVCPLTLLAWHDHNVEITDNYPHHYHHNYLAKLTFSQHNVFRLISRNIFLMRANFLFFHTVMTDLNTTIWSLSVVRD